MFSTFHRAGHRIEPRVFWQGMGGIALARVARIAMGAPSPTLLEIKQQSFARLMKEHFLDRGYVIVRTDNYAIADQADAAIWTGLYAGSQAMRYKVTQSRDALKQMEISLWAIHRLVEKAPIPGTMVRYLDGNDIPLAQASSKDTYTGFFYAVAQCLPYVQDPALRRALRQDVKKVADHFLNHQLSFQSAYGPSVDLKPFLSKNVFLEAYEELQHKPASRKKWVRLLTLVQWYFRIHAQKPPLGLQRMIDLLQEPDVTRMEQELVPIVNDLRLAIRKLQQNVHRSALRGAREGLTDTPYSRLDVLLLRVLTNLDQNSHGKPFERLEDLKILPSQSVHSLHFIKVAAEALPKPNRFDLYYRSNLYEGMALLRTAMQWHQMDEDVLTAVVGETESNTLRTAMSHLSYLALFDLITLEKDPLTRFKYQKIFEARYRPMRADGNAMIDAMQATVGLSTTQLGLAWWSLERYPSDRLGKGSEFWQTQRQDLVTAFGGEANRKTRDPIPPDMRPRDAFLWQRSARAITGDHKDWLYPPLDYLFAYWLARSAASLEAVAEKS